MPSTVTKFNMTGLSVDLPPYQVPPKVWTLFRNVEVNEGFPRRARGFGRIFGDTLHLPRHMVSSQRDDVAELVYGSDTAVAVTDGTVHNDITGAIVFDSTGDVDPWSSGTLNNIAILNNNTGPAFSWTPGDLAVLQLPDWPNDRRAGALRVYREFLIAMDITEGGVRDGDLIRWSDAAPANDVPQSWTAGTQSLAGSASAAFTPGNLVDGFTLRDQFFIYKTHATYVMQLVGGSLVMSNRPVFGTLGALARNCIVEWRGQHVVLTDGDIVIHNGVEAQSIVDRRVRSAIFSGIDESNFRNTYVVIDKEQAEIWFCAPQSGEVYPSVALVWSILDNEFGFRELGAGVNRWPHGVESIISTASDEPTWNTRTTTWSTDSSDWDDAGLSPAFEQLIFGDEGNLLQGIDQLDSFDGTTPVAVCFREGLDFGAPDKMKYVSRIWPKIEGTNGSVVQVRVGGALEVNGPITFDQFQDYTIGTTVSLGVNASGRYIAVEFRSESDATWRSPAFDLQIKEMGRF